MIFHVTALATVTFDGFAETPAWLQIQNLVWPIIDILNLNNSSVITTLGSLFSHYIFL